MVEKIDWAAEGRNAQVNWLKEHLPYEVKMVRHSLRRLNEVPRPWVLDWNAYLSAFAVGAGNVVAFLTNADKQANNVKACDFVIGFRSRKPDNLREPFVRMERYVFHLGKYRPTDDKGEEKFDLKDAKLISDWVELELKDFVG